MGLMFLPSPTPVSVHGVQVGLGGEAHLGSSPGLQPGCGAGRGKRPELLTQLDPWAHSIQPLVGDNEAGDEQAIELSGRDICKSVISPMDSLLLRHLLQHSSVLAAEPWKILDNRSVDGTDLPIHAPWHAGQWLECPCAS